VGCKSKRLFQYFKRKYTDQFRCAA